MKLIKNSLICLIALVVLMMAAKVSSACSCAVSPNVDIAFEQTPNVVILKLQSVEKYAENEKGYGYNGVKQSNLTVEKVFKGNLKVGQELIFAQGSGADCIWTFGENSVGEEYLFYLSAKPLDQKASENIIAATVRGNLSVGKNVWVAYICSRSGNVKYHAGDLSYLENLAKARGKTRLSGVLRQNISPATENEEDQSHSLANFKVKINGIGKNIELKTDENGFYEIYDLPPGKYKITPEKIDGFSAVESGSAEVEIKPRSHTERNFDYEISNRVSGKFFDANGKPLKDVCLHLIPAHGKKAQYFYQGDCTKEDGSFKFGEIPAGAYLLIVNEKNEISAEEPFGAFYYPSVTKREDAAEINIGAGSYIDNLIVTAPTTAEVITVSGVLLFENGKPVGGESVEFYSEESLEKQKDEEVKDSDSRAQTDKNGRFTIRILKGQKGKLLGSMSTYEGDFENCPKIDRLIREKNVSKSEIFIADIETPSIDINAVSDLTEITLKFPFPACKKAKIE